MFCHLLALLVNASGAPGSLCVFLVSNGANGVAHVCAFVC